MTGFKYGQDILRTLIVLKRRIIDRQIEWALADAYLEFPALGTIPSLSSTSAGVTQRLETVFREKTDYRIEFEKLLGGKVEDTRPRNISLSPIPSSSVPQFPEKGTQNDEDGPKTEGIEFRRPTRSESHLPR